MNGGIYFFNNDDFVVRENMKGKLLSFTEESKGLYLVLFYSKECPHCDKLLTEFKQLPNLINGCKFVIVNINKNPGLIEKSKMTISPITYVPDVILYVNGLPYIRYDGPSEMELLKNFILDIYQKLQKTSFLNESNPALPQRTSQPAVETKPKEEEIPSYSIGKPVCGNAKDAYDRCYLEFDNAYVGTA
jgi:thioredoxin-like negative regulator of GroEL